MDFLKKMFRDKQSKKNISFFSTDNNVLCEDGKYLRENITAINNSFNDINLNLNSINSKLNTLDNRFTLQDWELVSHGILSDDSQSVLCTTNNNGEDFLYSEVVLFFKVPILSSKMILRFFNNSSDDATTAYMQDNSFGDTREKYYKYHMKVEMGTIQSTKYDSNFNHKILGASVSSTVYLPSNLEKINIIRLGFSAIANDTEYWIYGR